MNELKMYADVKAAWVARLRSGRDRQGRGGLKNADGLCCLGVLCEVVGIEPRTVYYNDDWNYLGQDTYLPTLVARGSGLNADDPLIPVGTMSDGSDGGRGHLSLAAMNDGGLTFPQIADVIDYFIEEER